MQGRDTTIDGLKFILIVLVVVGHLIIPWRYTQWGAGYLYSLIYFFHMSLFFVIAGYFSKKTSLRKLAKGSVRQMESFVWLSLFLVLILHDVSNFYILKSHNWFLISLVCCKVMNFLFAKLIKRGWQLLALSFALYVVSFFVVGKYNFFMAIENSIQFYPCFVIGYLLSADQLAALRQSKKVHRLCYAIIPLLLVIIAVYSGRDFNLLEYHNQTAAYPPQASSPGVRLLQELLLTTGSILTCLIILALSEFKGRWTKYGQYTLLIYIVQSVVTEYVLVNCSYHFYVIPLLVVAVVAISIILCRYIPHKWLTAPICSLAESINARR